MRWRLDLGFDGAAFQGWAAQPGLRTVQGVIESWIAGIVTPAPLTVAGRTDAGVHARGQVAHVDLPDDVDGADFSRRLRKVLPDDIALYSMSRAPAGFDARFSALSRHYCYRLWDDASVLDPLHRGHVVRVPGHLDLEAMNIAAASLLGLRDFVPFCKYREGATSIRTLLDFAVTRSSPRGAVLCTVSADAFCHSMVRSLVGAILVVGQGKRNQRWLENTARLDHRAGDVPVMPAHGLVLEHVSYPPNDELATRATQARARRDEKR